MSVGKSVGKVEGRPQRTRLYATASKANTKEHSSLVERGRFLRRKPGVRAALCSNA